MALAKKCDRCWKLYEHYPIKRNNYSYNAIRYCLVDDDGCISNEYTHKDLCPECLNAFIKFMTMEQSKANEV